MSVMTADDSDLYQRHWTIEALDELPENGKRHEIIEGRLIMSPAPVPLHQTASREILLLLHHACPADMVVFYSPIDYRIAWDTSLQPDLVVMRRADVDLGKALSKPAVLVVEIISPGSRTEDLKNKPPAYARSGAAYYWTFEPKTLHFVAWRLDGGSYVEMATARGKDRIRLDQPYPVEICPEEIVNG